MCRSTNLKSNKMEFFILWFYVIYCDFSKHSAKINKNKKVKPLSKPGQGCNVHSLKVEGCILSSLKFRNENQTFAKVEGRNVDFFLSRKFWDSLPLKPRAHSQIPSRYIHNNYSPIGWIVQIHYHLSLDLSQPEPTDNLARSFWWTGPRQCHTQFQGRNWMHKLMCAQRSITHISHKLNIIIAVFTTNVVITSQSLA